MHAAHLKLSFFPPCNPALLSVYQINVFHMMTSLQFPKAPGLQGNHVCDTLCSYFAFFFGGGKEVCGYKTVVLVQLMSMCVMIQFSVLLRLRCLLHSNGTPTLNRYIVDIRALTSSLPHSQHYAVKIALVPPAVRQLLKKMSAAGVGELP